MRTASARSMLLSATALGAAVVWGLAEFFALQWSGFKERLRMPALFRTL